MKKLGITGYYGMSNYGDDLFGIVSYLAASKYWLGFKPKILSPPLEGVTANYGYVPLIPRRAFQLHNPIGQLTRAGTLIVNSVFLDKFVFAGGSLFQSGRAGVHDLVYLVNHKSDFFSAIGVSVGPFDSLATEKKVQDKLRLFEYLAVRDRVSYERLQSFNLEARVVQAADLAGLASSVFPVAKNEKVDKDDELRVGFSPCFLSNRLNPAEYYCDLFIETIVKLAKKRPVIVDIICLNQHYKVGDVDLCRYTQMKLSQYGVSNILTLYKDVGVIGTWNLISQLNAYFSVRLHGAITAYLCNIPFFLFEYHEKCTQFLDFIGKSSCERHAFDKCLSEDFEKVFNEVIASKKTYRLEPEQFSKLSELNFTESPLCGG